MAFQRGFKSWANKIASDTRTELNLGAHDQLDPRLLAEELAIPVIDLSVLREDAPSVSHLLTVSKSVFSAVTVFDGTRRAIVHNDSHAPVRQNSNISHELGHGLLAHPPTPAMDDTGCRIWNADIEDEATWLAGCLLIPEPATLAIARGRWSVADAAIHFGVSEQMVLYRVNATGAQAPVQKAQAVRR